MLFNGDTYVCYNMQVRAGGWCTSRRNEGVQGNAGCLSSLRNGSVREVRLINDSCANVDLLCAIMANLMVCRVCYDYFEDYGDWIVWSSSQRDFWMCPSRLLLCSPLFRWRRRQLCSNYNSLVRLLFTFLFLYSSRLDLEFVLDKIWQCLVSLFAAVTTP